MGARLRHSAPMAAPDSTPGTTRTVTLVLDLGSQPISGRIEGGEAFTGWLQLAAALQELAEGHVAADTGADAA
jgi:hypothetical protein